MKNNLINTTQLSYQLCEYPIKCRLAYATKENFLGRIVDGYHENAVNLCLTTHSTARALCTVQNELNKIQLGLFVFDSYRPLRSVKDFNHWMREPVKDEYELIRKKIHYPHIEKNQLANLGYVCDEISNHCFGDTVDLSLIHLSTNTLLEMGTCFDYFDELSYPNATAEKIGQTAFKNRKILSEAMENAGFYPYEKEYWHFTFHQREIDYPIDIEISAELSMIE